MGGVLFIHYKNTVFCLKSFLVEKKPVFCYDDALNCILGDKYAGKPRAKKTPGLFYGVFSWNKHFTFDNNKHHFLFFLFFLFRGYGQHTL